MEHLASPTSPTFDPFSPKPSPQAPQATHSSFDPFNKKKEQHSPADGNEDVFDLFSKGEQTLSPGSSSKDVFDPFGTMASLSQDTSNVENNRAKSPMTTTGIQQTRKSPIPESFTSTPNQHQTIPDLFGDTDAKNAQNNKAQFTVGDDLFSVGGLDAKPSGQPRPDLLGGWDEAFRSDVKLNPTPSPLATPPMSKKSEKTKSTPNDPFADFANIIGQGGVSAFPSNQKLPSNQNMPSPSQTRKPPVGQAWNQPKPQTRPNGDQPKKPQQPAFTQAKAKPNYTPTYSTSQGGSSVFGEYGLRTSHSK